MAALDGPRDGRDPSRTGNAMHDVSGSARWPVILLAHSADAGRRPSSVEAERASVAVVVLAAHVIVGMSICTLICWQEPERTCAQVGTSPKVAPSVL